MNSRDSPLYWSFPCGTLFATRVRVSVYMPLVLVLLCIRLESFKLGVVFGLLLCLSVVIHEFAHVFAARATGGSSDEILIWPLGGLAAVRPSERLSAKLMTTAAGPFSNLVLCLLTIVPVCRYGMWEDALHPFVIPSVELTTATLWKDLIVLLFCANWVLLIVNLIPVHPLDGGRMVRDFLQHRVGETGVEIYLKVGYVVAFVAMVAGVMVNSVWLVFIGAIVLVMNMLEAVQHQVGEPYDESFLGYDFSEGYTSLERSASDDESPAPRKPGFLSRWRERRREKRLEREREREEAEELQLDELLMKVQTHGMDALTGAEQRFLRQASERYRTKGRSKDA